MGSINFGDEKVTEFRRGEENTIGDDLASVLDEASMDADIGVDTDPTPDDGLDAKRIKCWLLLRRRCKEIKAALPQHLALPAAQMQMQAQT